MWNILVVGIIYFTFGGWIKHFSTHFQNASIEVIKKVWFKASSNKLSDPNQVEDYLSSFNEISKPCLKHIVNLQDDNVRN